MSYYRSILIVLQRLLVVAGALAPSAPVPVHAFGFGGTEEAQDSTMERAEMILEHEMKSEFMSGKMVTKYKGNRARCDYPKSMAGDVSVLLDLKKDFIAILMHDQKSIVKMPLEAQRKSVTEQFKNANIDLKKVAPPKPTGKKEKVGKWNAEIFETKLGTEKARFWVVKDFPNYRSIQARMAKFEMNGGYDPHSLDLGGLVVKSEMHIPPMGAITMTILRVREEAVEEKEFVVPADYTEPGVMP
jgi:hypothetical protein